MTPSNACYEIIKRFEGLRLNAYPDPGTGGDPWTIGYGHTGPDVRKGVTWTQQQAEDAIRADVNKFATGVDKLLAGKPTKQCQFDALVSFAYNVGLGNLKSSTLLRKHLAGDYNGAAGQFDLWNKANKKVLPGLVTRRNAEEAMYRG